MYMPFGALLIMMIVISGCGRYSPAITSINPLYAVPIRVMPQPPYTSDTTGVGTVVTELFTGVDITMAPRLTSDKTLAPPVTGNRELYVGRGHISLAFMEQREFAGAQANIGLFFYDGQYSEVRREKEERSMYGGGVQFDSYTYFIYGPVRAGFGLQFMLAGEFGSYQKLWIWDRDTWLVPQMGMYFSVGARLSSVIQLAVQGGFNTPGGARLNGSLTLGPAVIWGGLGYLERNDRIYSAGIAYRVF